MENGLYQVSYKGICAGFVVENGRITMCAPVLRRKLDFFKTIATKIQEGQMNSPLAIGPFDGQFRFLSNFYFSEDQAERLWGYPTMEHYYQAMKTTDVLVRGKFKIGTPGQAKRLGQTVALREDWEEIKKEVMLTGLRRKFAPDTLLARLLLGTDQASLIEFNNWHDTEWGVCTGKCRTPHQFRVGHNYLGKLLEQVREELRVA